MVGLHAECSREGDRPASDYSKGSREKAPQGHLYMCSPQSQNQWADQGHEQPAAWTDAG